MQRTITEADFKILPTMGLDKAAGKRSPLESRECRVHEIIKLYELRVGVDEICTPNDEQLFIKRVNNLTKKELLLLQHHWTFLRDALSVIEILRLTVR